MHYTWFEIDNFKSFARERFEFDPGFNLVVGRNSAGKSALLQALSLRMGNEPHRSLESIPTPIHSADPISRFNFEFRVSSPELKAVLQGPIAAFSIPLPIGQAPEASGCERLWSETLESATLRFTGSRMDGSFQFVEPFPGWKLYPTAGAQAPHAYFERQADRTSRVVAMRGLDRQRIEFPLAAVLQGRVFYFQAERLNVSQHQYGQETELSSDARNLPQVLGGLVADPMRYQEYQDLVSRVLPEIKAITARPAGSGVVEIAVWEHRPDTRRMDLAMPLAACGTGVSQVLAMLYVLVNADSGRILLVDEPNSFLHPGALRELLAIFREHPEHQYIISTHSPQIISDSGRVRVYMLTKKLSTKAELLDPGKSGDVKEILGSVGARLSDVFGAERVLWVEGATEERCFEVICEKQGIAHRGTVIASVVNTGDFDGRKAEATLRIYRRLTAAPSLVPPALAFIFDREKKTPREIEDLERQGRGAVHFLKRRMYENYLLDAEAVAAVLNDLKAEQSNPVAAKTVGEALAAVLADPKLYLEGIVQGVATVDGARVLERVFSELTQARHEYVKTRHAEELTRWLLANRREALEEVSELLRRVLSPGVSEPDQGGVKDP